MKTLTKIQLKNKLIAQFMGWYIDIDLSEKYPTQEWHTTRNKNGGWGCSRCVHIDKEDVEEKRKEIDSYLWDSLCNNVYGRGGQYNKDWNKLMLVINEIKKISKKPSVELLSWSRNNNTIFDLKLTEASITQTYERILKFIKFYNQQTK